MQVSNKNIMTNKSKIFWGFLFLCIAVLSIISIVSFQKSFSISLFLSFLGNANIGWLCLAVFSVFLFIVFEGLSLKCIYTSFGYKVKKGSSFVYSAADIYFSAITPSASGGQPASAYFMVKDGIPFSIVTLSLLYTLFFYSLSIIVVFLLSVFLFPHLFFQFNLLAKIIVISGFVIQLGLVFVFYCLLYKEQFLNNVCTFFLKLMVKLHLLRSGEEKLHKLNEMMMKYQEASFMIKGKRKLLWQVFFCNLFQRFSQIGVIAFVFLATGGSLKEVFSILGLQTFAVTGMYSAPIPGAIGVTDYLMIQGFEKLMPIEKAVNLELLSRGLSFYFCVLICGCVILGRYFVMKRSSKK